MGKDTKSLQARTAAKQQRETVRLGGLKSCRLAAGLTQKALAERVGSNQTTLADLENWDKADTRMIRRLREELKVEREDLVYRRSVEDTTLREGRDPS
jgi:DNA-binding XRE family transcriptional regulator